MAGLFQREGLFKVSPDTVKGRTDEKLWSAPLNVDGNQSRRHLKGEVSGENQRFNRTPASGHGRKHAEALGF